MRCSAAVHAVPIGRPSDVEAWLGGLPAGGRFCLDGDPAHPEGRWTFLGAEPVERVEVPPGPEPLAAIARGPAPGDGGGPLSATEIPWWVVTVAYDAAWADPGAASLRRPPRLARGDAPVLTLARHDALVALDERTDEAWALGESEERARALVAAIEREGHERAEAGEVTVEDPARHRARIEAALDAIGRGEIYQVNLARPWRAPYSGSPLPLWRAMRGASEVPLGAFVETESRAVVARTMERFLRWDRGAGRLWTSPIKGTLARRGDDASEARALRADHKERAEHSMIVDLMRNDLSRVAKTGSVSVREPLRVEPFRGLHHLVSTVECEPREDVDARAILDATFPPGSVTGTPKLRAMELIEEHEDTPRGLYTGAIGFLDRMGGLSLAVAIRTAVIEAGRALYFAGGGLVSASDVDREIAETELKARVFLEALEEVRRKKSV